MAITSDIARIITLAAALTPGGCGNDPVRTPPADTDTDAIVEVPAIPPFNGCTAPDGERATGTWEDPIAAAPPFSDRSDTTTGTSRESAYSCAPDVDESGPEVVYHLDLPAAAHLVATVVEGDGVDVDLHLLDGQGCVSRANTALEQDVAAGEYTLVVDSYVDGDVFAGAYELTVEAWPDDAWVEVPVASGLSWRHLRSVDGALGSQTIDVVSAELTAWDGAPVRHAGCERVDDVARARGARVGLNGGFFDGSCRSLDLVRHDGVTLATPDLRDRARAVAWDDGGSAATLWLARGEDTAAFANAVGSFPSLVTAGAVELDPYEDTSFTNARHPRTALGVDATGRLLLATADGRTEHGAGLSLAEWAAVLVEVGAVDAVNLDGGGSTTLFVDGCGPNGVVNHPSDAGGPRPVADALYLTGPP